MRAMQLRYPAVHKVVSASLLALPCAFSTPLAAHVTAPCALTAAHVRNFAQYTEWPALPARFDVCVVGGDGTAGALGGLSPCRGGGRNGEMSHIHDVGRCEVAVFPTSDKGKSRRQVPKRPPTLMIGDHTSDPDAVMIRLLPLTGRLGFEVNQKLAQAAGLSFSAKLLRQAERVY